MQTSSLLPNTSPILQSSVVGSSQTTEPSSIEISNASKSVLSQASQTIQDQFDFSLKTTHSGAVEIRGLLNQLAKQKSNDASMRVALVSGGSMAGYATALKLRNNGFQVIVAEKRPEYTRQNSFILKKEAFFSLANLSPDGSLLRSLLQKKLLDVHRTNLMKQDGATSPLDLVTKPNTAERFMDWLSNAHGLQTEANVPKRVPLHKSDAGHLDLAWPNQEPLQSLPAKDWRYDDLSSIGSENLGLAQFRNLEKGLNEYCVKQPGIHVLNAAVSLSNSGAMPKQYTPSFSLPEGDQTIAPSFAFDLICLAEGANSPNAAVLGEPTVIPHVESWYQANFAVPNQGLHGFFGSVIDTDKKQITAVQHMERAGKALINVSLGVPPDQAFDEVAISTALKNASHLSETAGLPVDLSTFKKEFEAKRIDVHIKRTPKLIDGNLIVIGDAAGSGSPVGAFGGGLALSAYPEVVERLITHPDFNKPDKREAVEHFFENAAAQIVKIRHNEPSKVMNTLGFYSKGVYLQQLKNADAARLGIKK